MFSFLKEGLDISDRKLLKLVGIIRECKSSHNFEELNKELPTINLEEQETSVLIGLLRYSSSAFMHIPYWNDMFDKIEKIFLHRNLDTGALLRGLYKLRHKEFKVGRLGITTEDNQQINLGLIIDGWLYSNMVEGSILRGKSLDTVYPDEVLIAEINYPSFFRFVIIDSQDIYNHVLRNSSSYYNPAVLIIVKKEDLIEAYPTCIGFI